MSNINKFNPIKYLPIDNLIKYFRDFVSYAGYRFYALIVLMLVSGLVEGVGIGMFIPILNQATSEPMSDRFSQAINSLFISLGMEMNLTALLFLLTIIFFIKGCLLYLQVLAITKISADLTMSLRLSLSKKYALMDYNFFLDKSAGYLNNLITTEVTTTVSGLNKYCELIGYIIYISVYLCFATILNYKMTIFVMIISTILFFSFKFLYRLTAKYSTELTQLNALMQSSLIQIIYNYKYLKATNSFQTLHGMLSGYISKISRMVFRLGALGGIFNSIVEPFVILFMCALIFYYVVLGQNPLSEIMILLVFFHRTFTRVFSVQTSWQKFNAAIGGVNAIKTAQTEIDNNREKIPDTPVSAIAGDLIFKDVSYAYGSKIVLFDLNFHIPLNKSVAIVGESGAGKTTYFDLLTGLLEPKSGTIALNGIDFRHIDKASLRSKIGYVIQDPVVFNDTIANNISFWNCNFYDYNCEARIKRAAQMAYCSEFIDEMKDGYNSIIGDKGAKLSGGQRQRIAIAREIFKNPEIMIFDEATSSLDTESEQYIQKSIDAMIGKCTIIIIAHRLSTIKNCDYIYVMSKGRIVEEGKFDELYSIQNGLFRKMCLAQQI